MSNIQSLATIDHEGHSLELLIIPLDAHGFDFYELRWSKDGVVVSSITKDRFQKEAPYRRWVSGLVDFDPLSGKATIQVGQQPTGQGVVEYTLREWDLNLNKEIKFLRVCDDALDD